MRRRPSVHTMTPGTVCCVMPSDASQKSNPVCKHFDRFTAGGPRSMPHRGGRREVSRRDASPGPLWDWGAECWERPRCLNGSLPGKQTLSRIEVLPPPSPPLTPSLAQQAHCANLEHTRGAKAGPDPDTLDPLLKGPVGHFFFFGMSSAVRRGDGLRDDVLTHSCGLSLFKTHFAPSKPFSIGPKRGHGPAERMKEDGRDVSAGRAALLPCSSRPEFVRRTETYRLICHLIGRPWAFKVTQIWDPGTLMYLSQQKAFLSPGPRFISFCYAQLFLMISVSLNHFSSEACAAMRWYPIFSLLPEGILQTSRRGAEREVPLCWCFSACRYVTEINVFTKSCVFLKALDF